MKKSAGLDLGLTLIDTAETYGEDGPVIRSIDTHTTIKETPRIRFYRAQENVVAAVRARGGALSTAIPPRRCGSNAVRCDHDPARKDARPHFLIP